MSNVVAAPSLITTDLPSLAPVTTIRGLVMSASLLSGRSPDDDRGVLPAEAERVDLHDVDVERDRLAGHHVEVGRGVHVTRPGGVRKRAALHGVGGGHDAHRTRGGTGVAEVALERADRQRHAPLPVDA